MFNWILIVFFPIKIYLFKSINHGFLKVKDVLLWSRYENLSQLNHYILKGRYFWAQVDEFTFVTDHKY